MSAPIDTARKEIEEIGCPCGRDGKPALEEASGDDLASKVFSSHGSQPQWVMSFKCDKCKCYGTMDFSPKERRRRIRKVKMAEKDNGPARSPDRMWVRAVPRMSA